MAIINGRTGERTHEGATLSGAIARPGWAFSDYGTAYYARVWDGSAVVEVNLGVVDYEPLTIQAVEDASPVVRALADAWDAARARERAILRFEAERAKDARGIFKGSEVVVVRGRKVAKGTRGIVLWRGVDNYGKDRVGFKVEGESKLTYTALSNVERTPESMVDFLHEIALREHASITEWQARQFQGLRGRIL
jgi:hypothetical protein